jgi:hypothetical protein
MQARLLLTALAVLAATTGCEGRDDEPRREPAATGRAATPSPPEATPLKPLEFVGRRSPLVQRLWQPVQDLTPLRTVLPASLRFDEIRQAPLWHRAPIRSAVLAVGTEPQPYGVGEVAVMSPGGAWRVIDREALGMRDPEIVEQQFLLSPDGRLLALGDEYGVVILELAEARATRFEVASKDPVLHWWTPDGTSVVLTPRGETTRTLAVRVVERVVERLDFFAWSSSVESTGRVIELVPNPRSADEDLPASADAYTAIRRWRNDRRTSEVVELENAVPRDAQTGNQSSPSLVGIAQGSHPEGQRHARGILAVDPATGRSRGLLALTPDQMNWASVMGALDDRWLLLDVPFGPGGGLAAWDPVAEDLRGVLPIDEQAADVSVAMELLSDSLR